MAGILSGMSTVELRVNMARDARSGKAKIRIDAGAQDRSQSGEWTPDIRAEVPRGRQSL
jgi:hypothetical protein